MRRLGVDEMAGTWRGARGGEVGEVAAATRILALQAAFVQVGANVGTEALSQVAIGQDSLQGVATGGVDVIATEWRHRCVLDLPGAGRAEALPLLEVVVSQTHLVHVRDDGGSVARRCQEHGHDEWANKQILHC